MPENNNNSNLEDVQERLDRLSEALSRGSSSEAPSQLANSSVLNVEKLTVYMNRYLSQQAQEDMSRQASTLTELGNDGKVYKAIQFAITSTTSQVSKAAKIICEALNDLSDRRLIRSTLSPLSALQLVIHDLDIPTKAVFSIVLVPVEEIENIKNQYEELITEEGGIGNRLEDILEIPRETVLTRSNDGEFFATIKISHTLTMVSDTNVMLQNELINHLNVLPRGTEILEITQLPIEDLSVNYKVKFYNPIMTHIKRVELEYVRSASMVNGELKQFNLLRSVRYFDENNQETA